MKQGYFITGTDTDAGKTWIAAGLITALRMQGRRVAAMKPLACGCRETAEGWRNGDAEVLMSCASIQLPYELVNPYALPTPAAPHIAAAEAGVQIELETVRGAFKQLQEHAEVVIVEGVGGWLVPLNEHDTTADLAAALGLPVILVVGMRLGCLNHALLSAAAITRQGLPLAGWVANVIQPQFAYLAENITALKTRIPAPHLGTVPWLPAFDAEKIAERLNTGALQL